MQDQEWLTERSTAIRPRSKHLVNHVWPFGGNCQKRLGWPIWLATSLFPLLQGASRYVQHRRKGLLRNANLATHSFDLRRRYMQVHTTDLAGLDGVL